MSGRTAVVKVLLCALSGVLGACGGSRPPENHGAADSIRTGGADAPLRETGGSAGEPSPPVGAPTIAEDQGDFQERLSADPSIPEAFEAPLADPALADFGAQVLAAGQRLSDLVAWDAQDLVERMVGADRGELRSREERLETLRRVAQVPESCVPRFSSGDGYDALAFPPAMAENTITQANAIDAGVEVLRGGVELFVLCMYDVALELGQVTREPRPVFVLNVGKGRGVYRVQAWATLDGRWGGAFPE